MQIHQRENLFFKKKGGTVSYPTGLISDWRVPGDKRTVNKCTTYSVMDDRIRFAYIFIFSSSFFMLHGALALFTEGLPGLYQNWGMGGKMNRQTAHPCESFFDEMIENCASSGHFIDFLLHSKFRPT